MRSILDEKNNENSSTPTVSLESADMRFYIFFYYYSFISVSTGIALMSILLPSHNIIIFIIDQRFEWLIFATGSFATILYPADDTSSKFK